MPLAAWPAGRRSGSKPGVPAGRNWLLDAPRGAPSWLPTVDDDRRVRWLQRLIYAVGALGVAACSALATNGPADPFLVDEDGRVLAEVPVTLGRDDQGAAGDDPLGGRDPDGPLADFGTVLVQVIGVGGATLADWCALLADTPDLQRRGLMAVTELEPWAGMVFLGDAERESAFWMRNTPLPLTVAYFDGDGRLVSSADMEPCEDSPDCPFYPPDGPYVFALEVPRGGLERLGIVEGTTVELGGSCLPPDDEPGEA